jgi:hypothetical protein
LELKYCKGCDTNQDIIRFHNDKRNKDGKYHLCKSCKAQEDKRYREKNREKLIKYAHEYRINNADFIAKQASKYYKNNRDMIIASSIKYAKKNKEKVSEYQKQYRINNIEKLQNLYFLLILLWKLF